VDGRCVSPGCGDLTCNVPGPHFPLADTSQRTCYDDSATIACPGTPGTPECATTAFCGQDAQYDWDVTHGATERFTRTGTTDPIVTDNVTGLIWQGCAAGLTGTSCGTGTAGRYDWAAALLYCDALSWSGLDDWRLPDLYELASIVDYGSSTAPTIDRTAFPATPLYIFFWSSSFYFTGSPGAWDVGFDDGHVGGNAPTDAYSVRCVRGGPFGVAARRFTRAEPTFGQPVVADAATGLVWQGCAAGQTGGSCSGTALTSTWQAALAYCQALSWGGSSDWFLPSVNQLASIVDERRTLPSIDGTVFVATPSRYFWSSSTCSGGSSNAWTVAFNWGYVSCYDKTNTGDFFVRCVRRGP
jgi:hypothetical protein